MFCQPSRSTFFEPLQPFRPAYQPQFPYFPSTSRENPRIGPDERFYAPVHKSLKTEGTVARSYHQKGKSRDNSYDDWKTDAQFSDDEDSGKNSYRNPKYTGSNSKRAPYDPLSPPFPNQNGQSNQHTRPNFSHEHQRSSHSHHSHRHSERRVDVRRSENDRKPHFSRQNQRQQPEFSPSPSPSSSAFLLQNHKIGNLKEIKEVFEKSLGQKESSSRLERGDSFPLPTITRDDSVSLQKKEGSVFKALLSQVRLEYPNSIKEKYMRKLNNEKLLDLSTIVYNKDIGLSQILYEPLPYNCSSCSMKFDNQISLDKHLNWHFETNMNMLNKSKQATLRPQGTSPKEWIKGKSKKFEEDFVFRNYVSAKNSQQSCKACREAFKEVWDADKEKWLLDQAAKIKYEGNECLIDDREENHGQEYELMHFNCFKLLLKTQEN